MLHFPNLYSPKDSIAVGRCDEMPKRKDLGREFPTPRGLVCQVLERGNWNLHRTSSNWTLILIHIKKDQNKRGEGQRRTGQGCLSWL